MQIFKETVMAGLSNNARPVVVTGLAGFTGFHLKASLEAHGFTVIGIDTNPASSSDSGLKICDLLDRPALVNLMRELQPLAVLHLAGISSVTHEDKSEIYRVNIMGTRNLLESLASIKEAPTSVVLASTANIYGNTSGNALDESTPPAPTNDYAVSKLAMEYMAGIFKEKLPITIVRPFNYTGIGQTSRFVVPKIVEHYKRRDTTLELGNINVVREFADVRRVVEAYVRLLENPQPGQIFNICSGLGTTLNDIISSCSKLSGHNLQVKVNPAFVRENEVQVLIGSCAKLEAAIGKLPMFTIQDTLGWMLEA